MLSGWQQALFIAKKNTGKKAKEWKISKDFDDDKNKKYWEVYYFEDRDRFLVNRRSNRRNCKERT